MRTTRENERNRGLTCTTSRPGRQSLFRGKRWAWQLVFVCGCLFFSHSVFGNTVVVVEASASSDSPNVCIQMKSDSDVKKDVREIDLAIYQRIEHGEHLFWSGETDLTGKACPPALPNGRYRLFASTARLDATLDLTVTKAQDKIVPLTMELINHDYPSAAALMRTSLDQAPLRVWLKTFRGVVQDRNKAVIPRAHIKVWRSELLGDKPAFETQTDARGQFDLPLTSGRYVADIQTPGFRDCVFAFEMTDRGWNALSLTMTIGGTPQLDSDFAELETK
jgi:hypothetical protein